MARVTVVGRVAADPVSPAGSMVGVHVGHCGSPFWFRHVLLDICTPSSWMEGQQLAVRGAQAAPDIHRV